eukprot:6132354-Heterocapsa_arctica.AAC.1
MADDEGDERWKWTREALDPAAKLPTVLPTVRERSRSCDSVLAEEAELMKSKKAELMKIDLKSKKAELKKKARDGEAAV